MRRIYFKQEYKSVKNSKFIVKAAGCIVASVVIGCLLMILAYMLPTDTIRENVAKSSQMIKQEGQYYQWVTGYKNAQLDNYTDASLYLNAMYKGSGSVLDDAMNNPRRLYDEDNNEESVVLYASGAEESENAHDVSYGRYWHGTLIFLKTMLQFFDLSDVRFINFMIQMGLLFLTIAGFAKRNLMKPLIGFFVAVMMLNPVTMAMGYCFSIEYILMLIGTSLILYKHEFFMQKQNYYYLFLWLGILTVYFNELSFPMIVFGIPMAVYMLISKEDTWFLVKKEILFGASWGIGYGATWMGKWICAWILTGYNYFAEALGEARRYTSEGASFEVADPSFIERLWRNVTVYVKWPFVLMILIVLVVVVCWIVKEKKIGVKSRLYRMLPYLLLVIFPLGVFLALGNGYSHVHYWFTHRLLAISGFAGVCMLLQLIDDKDKI